MSEQPTDVPEAADAPAEVTDWKARAEAAERERDEYLNLAKSTQAEFLNAQKRAARDRESDLKYAAERLARDLITALDNLDRALAAARQAGDEGPLAQGVSATYSQFLAALGRHGITRIEIAPGAAFDPNRHEAVMQRPAEGQPANTVLEVFQQGFMIHDRVLRPASVVVSAG